MRISAIPLRLSSAIATFAVLLTSNVHAQTNVTAEILPPDPLPGQFLGDVIALDGNLAAIASNGAVDPGDPGVVEIFRDEGPNGWVHEFQITSPPWLTAETSPFGFGAALALDGETLVVSNGYPGSLPDSRDVHVFRRNALSGTWNLEQTLTYPGSNVFPFFGSDVDVEGDVAIVGATFGTFGLPAGAIAKGVVYVYERVGTTWALTDSLTVDLSNQNTRLGHRVKIVGGRIVAVVRRAGNQAPQGVAVFVRSASGGWIQEALLDSTGTPNARIEELDYDGQTLAYYVNPFNPLDGPPVIVCHRRVGSTWTRMPDVQTTALPPLVSTNLTEDYSVSTSPLGGLAVRGDRIYFGSGASVVADVSGTVEVFEYDGAGWQFEGALQPPALRAGDRFGFALAQDEGRLLASSPGREDLDSGDATLNTGAVYVLRVDDPPLSSYCHATPLACTPCPCGNDAGAGATTGCANSSGVGARLIGSGQALPLDDSLRFDLEGGAPSSFAFLAVGRNALPNLGGACPPGSGVVGSLLDGKRCAGGGLIRLGVRSVDAQGRVGVTTTPWGGGNPPAGGLIAASGGTYGATLFYQAFYRDNGAGACGTGVNTSNGVKAVLLP